MCPFQGHIQLFIETGPVNIPVDELNLTWDDVDFPRDELTIWAVNTDEIFHITCRQPKISRGIYDLPAPGRYNTE
jgi:hypothetical protein